MLQRCCAVRDLDAPCRSAQVRQNRHAPTIDPDHDPVEKGAPCAHHRQGCHRSRQGRPGHAGNHPRSRPRSRRGRRRRPGVRGVPHGSPLPRRRHQRRVPVPPRPRGRGRRRGGRGRRHEREAGRLRRPQLARGLRGLPRGPPPSASRRRGSRPSTPATSRAPSSSSAYPPRT